MRRAPPGPGCGSDVIGTLQLLIALTAAIALTRRARAELSSPAHRGFVGIALGCVAWAAAQATVLGVGHVPSPIDPRPLAADVMFLLSGVGVAMGLVALVRPAGVARATLTAEAMVLALSGGWIAWELLVRAGDAPGTSPRHAAMGIAVATASLLPLAVAALALLEDRWPAMITASAAAGAIAAGEVVLLGTLDGGSDTSSGARHLLWSAGLVAYVAMAFRAHRSWPAEGRDSTARLLGVYGAVTLAVVVAGTAGALRSGPGRDLSMAIAASVAVALVVAQIVGWWQSTALAGQLESNVHRLRRAEADVRDVLDHLPDAMIVLAPDGTVLEANALALTLTGRRRNQLIGHRASELVSDTDRARVVEAFQGVLRGEPNEPLVCTMDSVDRGQVRVEATITDPANDPSRLVVTLRDVTRHEAAARRLEVAQERFRLAFHSAPTGMMLAEAPTLALLDVNESICRVLGHDRSELIGRTLAQIAHPDEAGRIERRLAHLHDGLLRVETRFVRSDKEVVWVRVSLTRLDGADGEQLVICHVEDITEQRKNAQRLEYAATHDQLTGLPNRTQFLTGLRERLVSAPVGSVAVLFIDLDNFKVINDSLGHAVGDQLLREMSDRLRSVVRDRDMLGRFGGDEFMVMLDDMAAEGSAAHVAERLRDVVGKPMLIDDTELFVTASIGIAVANRRGITADELMRDADAAMYRAKARGRDCVESFAPGSHESSVIALRTANELRHGLERGEIVPYYQPIIDLVDGRLTGFEVLARWRHPDRGLVGPDQFLPMAEETGLIGEVGLAVLRTSLAQVSLWRARSSAFSSITLSVNVSVRQLVDGRFIDQVSDALAESGLEADALWLEITETALMSDVKVATVALRELRSLGLHLAVDDFGTGYSSLTYLKRFPVEAIKVDRTFVNGLGIDPEDTTIVDAVVKLGHSLGLLVVAEGVETPLQLSRLRDVACDRGQGYLFGRPRPADLIEAERLDVR